MSGEQTGIPGFGCISVEWGEWDQLFFTAGGYHYDEETTAEGAWALAKLLEAAPDLLAALELVTSALLRHRVTEDAELNTRTSIAIDSAAAAIKKAGVDFAE